MSALVKLEAMSSSVSCVADEMQQHAGGLDFIQPQRRRSVNSPHVTVTAGGAGAQPVPKAHSNSDVRRQGFGSGMDLSVGRSMTVRGQTGQTLGN
jgi:hypothetical protein